jgi:hypothetical protein
MHKSWNACFPIKFLGVRQDAGSSLLEEVDLFPMTQMTNRVPEVGLKYMKAGV